MEPTEQNQIEVAANYADILKRLTYREVNGVREFYGGPLHLDEEVSDWVTPAEIRDGDGSQQFHILYLNTHPTIDNSNLPVTVLDIDEMALKLAGRDDPALNAINELLQTNEPRVVIRPTHGGMLYYPETSFPFDVDQELTERRIASTLANLSLGEIDSRIAIGSKERIIRNTEIGEGVTIREEKRYNSPQGTVNVFDIVLEDDPWVFYQVVSGKSIAQLANQNNVPMRLDSGCDIGQIYSDRGCDCRDQLHEALGKTIVEGGFIIHLPTQDGRGYGMVTKMETEGLKRGIPVVTNRDNPIPMDTIAAAKHLLGDNFDIRTYDGVGRIVKALGIPSVTMYTNNRKKVEGLTSLGIDVNRKSGLAVCTNGSGSHVEAKLQYDEIYILDEDE